MSDPAKKLVEKYRAELRAYLLNKISIQENGITLPELMKMAKGEGYEEKAVVDVLQIQEQSGEIFSDPDWKYRLTD